MAFCIYCGKQLPDGVTECDCQKQAANTQPDSAQAQNTYTAPQQPYGNYNNAQPGPQPGPAYSQPGPQPGPVYSQPVNNGPFYGTVDNTPSRGQTAMKELFSSGMFLVLAIATSVSLILQIMGPHDMNILGLLGVFGMWMCYSSAKKNTPKMTPGGLTMGSGILITEIVLLCIGFGLILIISLIIGAIGNTFWAELISSLSSYANINSSVAVNISDLGTAIVIILITVLICSFLFSLFYLITLRNSITCMRSHVNRLKPAHGVSLFPIIILFLAAIGSIFNAINMTNPTNIRIINNFINDLISQTNLNLHYTYSVSIVTVISYVMTTIVYIIDAVFLIKARGVTRRLAAEQNM